MQIQRPLILGAVISALSLGLGACGDDEKPKKNEEKDAGTKPPTTKPDGGSTNKPTTMTCGSNECTAPEAPAGAGNLIGMLLGGGGGAEVCCAGENEDLCGVTSSLIAPGQCFEQNQEGKADATCEGIALGGLISIPGCCKATNECGLNLNGLGLGVGCMERTAVSMVVENLPFGDLLGGLGGGGGGDGGLALEPLQAIPCVYDAEPTGDAGTDAGTGNEDAGTGDAGSEDAGVPDDAGSDDAST